MIDASQIEHTFERYKPLMGDEWPDFVAALTRPLPTCFWTNTLKTDIDTLASWFERLNIPVERLNWWDAAFKYTGGEKIPFGTLFPFLTGMCHIQEEVSLMPGILLDATSEDRVLDMCAAPGGKTAQIAVGMNNHGSIVANDRSYQRLRAMRAIVDRLGLANITMTVWDASSLQRELGEFDKILADVPCSCEGTSRKNPAIIEHGPDRYYDDMSRVQVAILSHAVRLAKPGATIVYSTCTYAPEENELVLQRTFDELGWDKVKFLPSAIDGVVSQPGLTQWEGQQLNPQLKHAMRVYPHHNDTGGFFIAKLQRCTS